jgi:formamidopyrimidine-DNA glycosylase
MPELPDVEAARKFLATFCNGKRIHQIITREQGNGPRHGLFDNVLFEQKIPENVLLYYKKVPTPLIEKKPVLKRTKSTPAVVEDPLSLPDAEEVEKIYQQLLTNKYIEAVKRKGKQIWFELTDSLPLSSSSSSSFPMVKSPRSTKKKEEVIPESRTTDTLGLLMHFGMTGSIMIKDRFQASYKSSKETKNLEWPPKFTKVEFILKDPISASNEEIRVAFTDPRRFGDIKLRLNPTTCPPLSSLGYDPSIDVLPSFPELYSLFHKERINIKTLLLNQEKIVCGIGNYLVDEILYQAKIHPLTNANEINEEGIGKMIEKMNDIISLAINCDANYKLFPKDWLFHYRWSKRAGKNTLPNGNMIVFETINGRTTAIVPSEQLKNGYYKIKNSSSSTPDPVNEIEVKKTTQKKKRKQSVMTENEVENNEDQKDVEKVETVKPSKRKKAVPQLLSETIIVEATEPSKRKKSVPLLPSETIKNEKVVFTSILQKVDPLLRRSSRNLGTELSKG